MREKCRRFAACISPPNWNFCLDMGELRETRNCVNVVMQIITDPDKETPGYHGMVKDMKFYGGAAYVDLILQLSMTDYRPLIIHELAHIAVLRWVAYKTKTHMRFPHGFQTLCFRKAGFPKVLWLLGDEQPPLITDVETAVKTMHGPAFRKAHNIFKRRYAKAKAQGITT